MPKCYKCGTEKNLLPMRTKGKTGRVYLYFRCRECNKQRLKAYRETSSGKEAVRRAVNKYEQKNPQRRQAWEAARMIENKACEKCGSTENIHRHHPDPMKPLEVIFLCPLHHKEAHKKSVILKVK